MNWLIDASSARHSGALTHQLGILPALDAVAGEDHIRVIASAELAQALDGRVDRLDIEVMEAREGVARLLALNTGVPARIRSLRPDAVVFGQYAPLRSGAPYVLRMTDAHLIDHAERARLLRFYSPAQRMGWRVKVAAFRRSVRRAGAVLCATHAVRDQLLTAHPELDPARVRVSHYGVSPLAEVEERHGGPRGRRMLTMHLSPRKNVESILDAMARPGMEAFELTVLGDLDHPTNRYTRFLADRARSLGVARRVHSVGYVRDPARLRRIILDHDVLLCPSRIESWSHTVVEGMAFGIAVVASDIACHREISDGSVWLVPPDDPGALARSVLEVVGSGAAVRRRLDRGHEIARAYQWSVYAKELLRSLRSAAA